MIGKCGNMCVNRFVADASYLDCIASDAEARADSIAFCRG
jgi:hypothetical protein